MPMAKSKRVLQWLAFAVGLGLIVFAGVFLAIISSGAVESGSNGMLTVAAAFALIAVPCFVTPFSLRWAKGLLVAVLALLALAALWAAFGSLPAIHAPAGFKIAAVAFAVLLALRVGLGWRRKRSGLGT